MVIFLACLDDCNDNDALFTPVDSDVMVSVPVKVTVMIPMLHSIKTMSMVMVTLLVTMIVMTMMRF